MTYILEIVKSAISYLASALSQADSFLGGMDE